MSTPASFTSPAAALHRHELLVVHSDWPFHLRKGILAFILGLLLVVAPGVSTRGVELLIGWVLIVGGFMWASRLLRRRQRRGFRWRLSSSAVAMTLGVLLVYSPSQGAIALTIVIMGLLAVTGVATVLVGLRSAPTFHNWILTPAVGLVTLMVAYVMWDGWPNTTNWAIGVCAGTVTIYLATRLIIKVFAAHRIGSAEGSGP